MVYTFVVGEAVIQVYPLSLRRWRGLPTLGKLGSVFAPSQLLAPSTIFWHSFWTYFQSYRYLYFGHW
jgi:hypothetical protein